MKRTLFGLNLHRTFLLAALLCLVASGPVFAGPSSLRFDFEGSADAEWATRDTYSIQGNKVLGLFNDKNKHYQRETHLHLKGVPPNTPVAISFDLYLVGTWDSTGELSDRWVMSVENGPTLLDLAKFPSAYADKEEKSPIGNKGVVTVGTRDLAYWVVNETVVVPADKVAGGALSLRFQGFLTGRKTEFWGLDNVSVKIGN